MKSSKRNKGISTERLSTVAPESILISTIDRFGFIPHRSNIKVLKIMDWLILAFFLPVKLTYFLYDLFVQSSGFFQGCIHKSFYMIYLGRMGWKNMGFYITLRVCNFSFNFFCRVNY